MIAKNKRARVNTRNVKKNKDRWRFDPPGRGAKLPYGPKNEPPVLSTAARGGSIIEA